MTITTSIEGSSDVAWSEPQQNIHASAPPLESGDRLSREEFERRYMAHPEINKAELVEGVVYVSSPVRLKQHCGPHGHIVAWLGAYCWNTPGVELGNNGTVRLDDENEPQPDAFLFVGAEHGGKSRISEDDYLEGAPDLVVEVAASSASYDLGDKLRAYQRNGVREYLVLKVYEREAEWFSLRDGAFVKIAPDSEGILRSEIFPGLWLKPEAFWSRDYAGLQSVLQRGLASPEHSAFVARLQEPARD